MSIFSICIKQGYQNARNHYKMLHKPEYYRYSFSKYISDVNLTEILDVSEIEV